MTRAILAGPDRDGLGAALEMQGIEVTRVEGVLTASILDEATAISVVKDSNPDIRVVVYSHDSLPNFVRGQTDLAMDPDLFGVDMVAEELA